MDTKQPLTQERFYSNVLHSNLPVIIVLSLIAFIGIIGNIVALVFYCTKRATSTVYLLTAYLAAVDLSVCIFLVVGAVEVGYSVTFTSSILCKLMGFAMFAIIFTSNSIVTLIGIDRYRRICQPFKRQMSFVFVKRSFAALFIIGLVCSSPSFITTDVEVRDVDGTKNNTSSILAFQCGSDKSQRLILVLFVNFQLIMFGIAFLVFIIAYSLIVRSLYIHRQKQKVMFGKKIVSPTGVTKNDDKNKVPNASSKQADRNNMDINEGETRLNDSTHVMATEENGIGSVSTEHVDSKDDTRAEIIDNKLATSDTMEEIVIEDISEPKPEEAHAIKQSKQIEVRTTIMMLVITVWFLACYVPYFVGIALPKGFPVPAPIHFTRKSPFLKSFFNPFIYFIFNQDYRLFIKSLFTRCFNRDGFLSFA